MRVAMAIRPRTVIGVRPDAQMLDRTSLLARLRAVPLRRRGPG
jgi:hypothetical protein